MHSIHIKSRVGPDGQLHLQIPTGLPDTDVEVLVVLNPIQPQPMKPTTEELGWPPGFFEQTFGSCQDEPLVRLPQCQADVREPIQ